MLRNLELVLNKIATSLNHSISFYVLKYIIFKFLLIICFFYEKQFAQDIEIISDGSTRSFKVDLPIDTSQSMPMMILLHGLGETNSSNASLGSYFANRDIVAIRPQSGSYLNSSGNANITLWNAILDSSRFDDVQFISNIIDYMLTNYHFINHDKIYVAGFSNGGYMSYRLSCDLSSRIAAFGSVAGNMFLVDDGIDCTDQIRDIPIIHIHGTSDTYNPYFPGGYGVFGNDIIGDEYLTISESIEFWSDYHNYENMSIDTIQAGGSFWWNGSFTETNSIRYTYEADSIMSKFVHIKAENGAHVWFYGDAWGFSSTQEILDFTSQFKLSDFIISLGDLNDDGLITIEDFDILIEQIFNSSTVNDISDLNYDQKIDIFDTLLLLERTF